MKKPLSKKEKELYELRNEISKTEIDKSYYQILERQNEEMHSFSHNTKNHFQVIKSLTNEKNVEEYIDNCYGELRKYIHLSNTVLHLIQKEDLSILRYLKSIMKA